MNGKLKYIVLAAAALIVLGVALIGLGKALGGERLFGGYSVNFGKVNSSTVVEGNVDIEPFDELTVENASIDFKIETGTEYRLEYRVFEGKEPIVTSKAGKLTIEEPETKLNINIGITNQEICYKLIVPENSSFEAKVSTTSGEIAISECGISGEVSSTSGGIAMMDIKGSELKANSTSGGIAVCEADYLGKVSIASSSGGVALEDIECSELSTKTTSGGCALDSVKTGKHTHSSSSGSFKANDMTADSVDITTTSGSINITEIKTGSIKTVSSSGSAKLALNAVESVRCEATSGHITIDLPGSEADYNFNISTTSGAIEVGNTRCEKNYSNGRSGKSVDVQNTSGGVTIEF